MIASNPLEISHIFSHPCVSDVCLSVSHFVRPPNMHLALQLNIDIHARFIVYRYQQLSPVGHELAVELIRSAALYF